MQERGSDALNLASQRKIGGRVVHITNAEQQRAQCKSKLQFVFLVDVQQNLNGK